MDPPGVDARPQLLPELNVSDMRELSRLAAAMAAAKRSAEPARPDVGPAAPASAATPPAPGGFFGQSSFAAGDPTEATRGSNSNGGGVNWRTEIPDANPAHTSFFFSSLQQRLGSVRSHTASMGGGGGGDTAAGNAHSSSNSSSSNSQLAQSSSQPPPPPQHQSQLLQQLQFGQRPRLSLSLGPALDMSARSSPSNSSTSSTSSSSGNLVEVASASTPSGSPPVLRPGSPMDGLVETAAALAGSQQSPSDALDRLSMLPHLARLAGANNSSPSSNNNNAISGISPFASSLLPAGLGAQADSDKTSRHNDDEETETHSRVPQDQGRPIPPSLSSASLTSGVVSVRSSALSSHSSADSMSSVAATGATAAAVPSRSDSKEDTAKQIAAVAAAAAASAAAGRFSSAAISRDADNDVDMDVEPPADQDSEQPTSSAMSTSGDANTSDEPEVDAATMDFGNNVHQGVSSDARHGSSTNEAPKSQTLPHEHNLEAGGSTLSPQEQQEQQQEQVEQQQEQVEQQQEQVEQQQQQPQPAPQPAPQAKSSTSGKSRQFVLSSIMAGLTPASLAKTTSRMLGGGRRKSSDHGAAAAALKHEDEGATGASASGATLKHEGSGSSLGATGATARSARRVRGTSASSRRWTEEEDERLRLAVAQYGDTRWKEIAAVVGTRNNVQCLQRWRKSLKPGLKKGSWRPEEDELLRQKVQEKLADPALNWTWVSKSIEGRNAKQCRERWQNFLDDSIKRGGWTEEEDRELERLHQEFGGRWARIARNMPGRTENSVKVRYQALKRMRDREASRDETGSQASTASAASTTASSTAKTKKKGAKRPSGVPADMEGMVGAARADHSSGWSLVSKFKKRKSASLPLSMQAMASGPQDPATYARSTSTSSSTSSASGHASSPPETPSGSHASDAASHLSTSSAATLPLPDMKRKAVRKSAPPSLMNAMQALQQALANGFESQHRSLGDLTQEVLMQASSPSSVSSVSLASSSGASPHHPHSAATSAFASPTGSSPSISGSGGAGQSHFSSPTSGGDAQRDAAIKAALAMAAASVAAPPTSPLEASSAHDLAASTITATTAEPPGANPATQSTSSSHVSLPRSHSFPSLQALTHSLGYLAQHQQQHLHQNQHQQADFPSSGAAPPPSGAHESGAIARSSSFGIKDATSHQPQSASFQFLHQQLLQQHQQQQQQQQHQHQHQQH